MYGGSLHFGNDNKLRRIGQKWELFGQTHYCIEEIFLIHMFQNKSLFFSLIFFFKSKKKLNPTINKDHLKV